ncbi:MAG TPA: tetratricopeptide repeat protein, partial [Candidatus Hydrogenedentes bacterium]|nr:tetratricopeptide repeat protein [Candidatus Hydrogenedentota bacterium]
MRMYQEALRVAPAFGYVLYKIGRILAEQGKAAEAEQRFREAINLDPENQDLHYLLGCELMAQGRKDDARKCFEQALRLNPEMPGPITTLACWW